MEIALLAAAVCIGIPGLMALLTFLTDRQLKEVHPQVREPTRDSVSRAALVTFVIWAVLTAGGLLFVLNYRFYPTVASDKGEDIEAAFRLLTALAVPVGAMVISILLYNAVRRSSYELPEDGPSFSGQGAIPRVWVAATAALTLLVIIHPGMTALGKILDDPESPDVVVEVEASQWAWLVSYPGQGVTQQPELVIPVNKTVRFNITSRDVLHSFWIPGLLMKVDAVPGRTTTLSLRATKTGEYSTDPQMRLQCAELCGLGHSVMRIPIGVVSESEFSAWLQSRRKQ